MLCTYMVCANCVCHLRILQNQGFRRSLIQAPGIPGHKINIVYYSVESHKFKVYTYKLYVIKLLAIQLTILDLRWLGTSPCFTFTTSICISKGTGGNEYSFSVEVNGRLCENRCQHHGGFRIWAWVEIKKEKQWWSLAGLQKRWKYVKPK